MLSKEQATIVVDQMLADAQRVGRDRQVARLTWMAGSKPARLTVEEFEAYVREAEFHVQRSWALWSTIAVIIAAVLTLAYWHLPQLLIGLVPVGLLVTLTLRRGLVKARVRRMVAADA